MKLKWFLTGLLLLSLMGAHAGVYKKCDGENKLPCPETNWSFEGDALWFKNQGNSFNEALKVSRGTFDFFADWGWGYRLEGRYYVNTGNDFTVNWSYYTETTVRTFGAAFNLTDRFGTLITTFAINDRLNFQSSFQIVNFEFGQRVDFGERFKLRGHAGLQWADLKEDYIAFNAVLDIDNADDHVFLEGYGTRVGLDLMYGYTEELDFFAKGASALIWMKQQIQSGTITGASGLFFPTLQGTSDATSIGLIVPEVDISIGLSYKMSMQFGDLIAKASWDQIAYIGANSESGNMAWGGVNMGLKWLGDA